MVHLDTTLGEQLLDIAVGQAEAQLPADRPHDDIRWEAEAGQGGSWHRRRATAARSHADVSRLKGGHHERNSALAHARQRRGERRAAK